MLNGAASATAIAIECARSSVNVPLIYGFSSKAPLGATAGPLLDRYFQSGANNGERRSATRRPTLDTLPVFRQRTRQPQVARALCGSSMTSARGLSDAGSAGQLSARRLPFLGRPRLSVAQKLGFVHEPTARDRLKCGCSSARSKVFRIAQRDRPIGARGIGGARRDRARSDGNASVIWISRGMPMSRQPVLAW